MGRYDLMSWPFGIAGRRRRVSPFDLLSQDINSLLSEFGAVAPREGGEEVRADFVPRINLTEDEKSYRVAAELPGMTEKDVQIELKDGTLTLRGEKKSQEERTEGRTHYIESSYGTFFRSIPLDVEIDEDNIDASYKNGVLTVVLPKSQRAENRAKKISVRAEK